MVALLVGSSALGVGGIPVCADGQGRTLAQVPASPAAGSPLPIAPAPVPAPAPAPASPPPGAPATPAPGGQFPEVTPGRGLGVPSLPAGTIGAGPSPRLLDLFVTGAELPAATFALHPFVTLEEEYTDNFRLTETDEEENFRTRLGVGGVLTVNRPRTRGLLATGYGIAYDTIDEELHPDRSFVAVARLEHDVTPLFRLTALDTLVMSDDALLGDSLQIRREREKFVHNTFSLIGDYLIPALSASTRGYYRLSTFWEDGEVDTVAHTLGGSVTKRFLLTHWGTLGYEYLLSDDDVEVTGHRVSGSVERQLTREVTVGLLGHYAIRDVEPGDDFDLWTVAAFGRYLVRTAAVELLELRAALGYTRLDRDLGSDRDSVFGRASLSYPLGRGVLTLSVDAGFSETYAEGENFGVVETRGVRGTFWYPLTPLVTGVVSGFYRENELTGVASDEPARQEDRWGGSAAVVIPLRLWLRGVLEYVHTRADSSVPGGDFTENRVRAALIATF